MDDWGGPGIKVAPNPACKLQGKSANSANRVQKRGRDTAKPVSYRRGRSNQ